MTRLPHIWDKIMAKAVTLAEYIKLLQSIPGPEGIIVVYNDEQTGFLCDVQPVPPTVRHIKHERTEEADNGAGLVSWNEYDWQDGNIPAIVV